MYKVRERGVVVRVVCRKTRGWFARVVEMLGEIGFAVKDVNVTTFDGKVLAILMLIEVISIDSSVQSHKLDLTGVHSDPPIFRVPGR